MVTFIQAWEIVGPFVGGFAVYLVTSYFTIPPRDAVSYWLRKNLRARNLNGLSISLSKSYELKNSYDYDGLLEKIGLSASSDNPVYKTLAETVKENEETTQFEKEGSSTFKAHYKNQLTNGLVRIAFEVNGDSGQTTKISIAISSEAWKYPKTGAILTSMHEILTTIEGEHLSKNFGKDLTTDNKLGITLRIERKPVAFQYLSKLSVGLIRAADDGVEYSLSKDKLTIVGKFQNDLIGKVTRAMIWYL